MSKEELENRKLERRAKEWLVKDKGGSIIQSLVNLIKEFIEPKEKEIAELRRNEFNARSCLELQQSQDKAILNYMGERLTKAKEIIKHLLDWQYDEYKKSETDKELFKVIAEAEKFLKDSEVEK